MERPLRTDRRRRSQLSDAEVIKKRQKDSLFPTAGQGAGTAEGAKGRKAEKQGGAASPKVV